MIQLNTLGLMELYYLAGRYVVLVEKIRFFSDMLNGCCFFLQTLKKHLLYYRLLNAESPLGFDLYEQLPPVRLKYLQMVTHRK